MHTTIQDILDLMIDPSFIYILKVWEESTGQERDYNEETDSDKEVNSFEFERTRNALIFNID